MIFSKKSRTFEDKNLNFHEKERYSRHILLHSIGIKGVKKIRQAQVTVIGAGGIGAPLLTYLAVSGIGQITIIDHDTVASTNLARQYLFQEKDIGKPKAIIATQKLKTFNPNIKVFPVLKKVTEKNFIKLTKCSPVIVETVDTIINKLLIHDLCHRYDKPLIHGAAIAMEAQFLTILPHKTPCLKCFFPSLGKKIESQEVLPWMKSESRDSCAIEGVLSPLCGLVGSMQAAEVLRFFTRPHNELFTDRMLRVDFGRNDFRYLYPQVKHCDFCGRNSLS